jgi:hypothetical protein
MGVYSTFIGMTRKKLALIRRELQFRLDEGEDATKTKICPVMALISNNQHEEEIQVLEVMLNAQEYELGSLQAVTLTNEHKIGNAYLKIETSECVSEFWMSFICCYI